MSIKMKRPRIKIAFFCLSLLFFICATDSAHADYGHIAGTVTDAQGVGISGVNVWADPEGVGGYWIAVTGQDGGYTSFLLPTDTYAIFFSASGYPNQYYNNKSAVGGSDLVSVIAPNTTSGIDAILTPGGNISGTVLNSAGIGLSAGVSVFDVNNNPVNYGVMAGSGLDGSYTLSNLLAGSYKVKFTLYTGTGYVSQWYDNKQNQADADLVGVTPSNTTTIKNAVLDIRGVISGKVADVSGNGVGGVAVSTYQDKQDLVVASASYTLQDGSYTLTGLMTGNYTIQLYGSGYLTQWYSNKSDQNGADMVAVTAPNATLVNVVLVHLGSISGRVTNAAGTGMANVTVVADPGYPSNLSTITAQDGSYTLNNLVNGQYKVQFIPQSGSGYLSQWYNNKSETTGADQLSVTAPGTISGIDAVLATGAIISGKLTSSAGTGIANAGVYLWNSSGGPTGFDALTGNDGSYTILGVPTGNYKIEFGPQSGSGYLNQWYNVKGDFNSADSVSITAPNAMTLNAVLSSGATISGIVTNAAGNGLSNVFINVYDSNGNYLGEYNTNFNGTYTIPHLYTGGYKVQFNPLPSTTGYLSQWYNNKADQQSADVINVTDPNTTTVNIVLRPYQWDLGSFEGSQYSVAYGTSADGAVVVGGFGFQFGYQQNTDNFYAFRWTQAEGMVNLLQYQHQWYSVVYGVSADGTVIVGTATDGAGNTHAFQWTQAGGMADLGTLPGGANAAANGVSADGTVTVGATQNGAGNTRAFRWTQAGGMADLGTLPGGANAAAYGVSGDGTVIVGATQDGAGNTRAFRWTQAGGMADLGTLPGGANAEAYGASADGTVIVGAAEDGAGNTRAFRWTQAGGMADLGTVAGGANAAAYGVSADGAVIVGSTEDSASKAVAFYWTNTLGMNAIGQWLTNNGISTSASEFSDAYAISANGKVIVGQLSNGQAFRIGIKILSTYYATIAPTGGGKSVNISEPNGESWTAVSNVPWITITSGSSGTANGTVQYSVASNTGGVRTGTITIAGQTLTVMQGTTLTYAHIGVFRTGAWYVDRDETFGWSGCSSDGCYSYGMAGDQAIAGDWDGIGIVSLGVFRNGNWYLDYNGDGQWSGCGTTSDTDRCYAFGQAGDIPVVGDWNGNGVSKIGVFRNGNWYLDYPGTGSWVGCGAPADPTKDACISYGMAGDLPIVGDWNGNGVTKVGVFRNGTWYLDYPGKGSWVGCGAPADPTKDACISYGMAGDLPIVGDWNGNGVTKVGVFRNGTWYLDYPGKGSWVGCGAPANGIEDVCAPFGMVGDIPVVFR